MSVSERTLPPAPAAAAAATKTPMSIALSAPGSDIPTPDAVAMSGPLGADGTVPVSVCRSQTWHTSTCPGWHRWSGHDVRVRADIATDTGVPRGATSTDTAVPVALTRLTPAGCQCQPAPRPGRTSWPDRDRPIRIGQGSRQGRPARARAGRGLPNTLPKIDGTLTETLLLPGQALVRPSAPPSASAATGQTRARPRTSARRTRGRRQADRQQRRQRRGGSACRGFVPAAAASRGGLNPPPRRRAIRPIRRAMAMAVISK